MDQVRVCVRNAGGLGPESECECACALTNGVTAEKLEALVK